MVNISSALSASIATAACSLFSDQASRRRKRLHGPSSDATVLPVMQQGVHVLCTEVKIGTGGDKYS